MSSTASYCVRTWPSALLEESSPFMTFGWVMRVSTTEARPWATGKASPA